MLESLAAPHGADDLDARLAEAQANGAALIRVVEAVGRARTLQRAIEVTLETVRQAFGWAYGSYWALDPATRALRFAYESGSVNPEIGSGRRAVHRITRHGARHGRVSGAAMPAGPRKHPRGAANHRRAAHKTRSAEDRQEKIW